MGKVTSTEAAGSIIRRVREEKGISRAQLAADTNIGARTLYALETGESENFGLGNYLRLIDKLGLSLSVDYQESVSSTSGNAANRSPLPWDDLADIWKLDNEEKR